MGIEYKIHCSPEVASKIDVFLRRRFITAFDEGHSAYGLCLSQPDKGKDWSDVTVAIEADGIYFCDNLSSANGEAERIFRAIIDEIMNLTEFETVRLSRL